MKRGMILVLVILCRVANGQSEVTGDLLDHVSSILSSIPGASQENYTDPDNDQQATWTAIVNAILDEDITTAATQAATLNYEVVHFTDDTGAESKSYYILQRAEAGPYWGTYIFNPNPCRAGVVIQAPHPLADLNTGKQGIYVFEEIEASAFFVSGTHRCNSASASSCSGSTSVCSGSSQAFRLSDVAHNNNSAFQKATEAVRSKSTTAVFIQLHGFAKESGDPSMIMSNGTRIAPSLDYITLIREALIDQDGTLTAKVAHEDLTWDKLVALTNTQGRMLNGSFNPCTDNATSTQGRFIHIEQELTKLRADQTRWALMATALASVFPCGTITSGEEELSAHTVSVFPNPFSDHVAIRGIDRATRFVLYNVLGMEVAEAALYQDEIITLPALTAGTYYYRLLCDSRLLGKGKLYSINHN